MATTEIVAMALSTHTEYWLEVATAMPRDEFVSRHPGYFLLCLQESTAGTDDLETLSAELATSVKRAAHSAFEVKWVRRRSDEPSSDERVSVGRGPSCDIQLPHRSVSKVHAYLCVEGSSLSVVDVDSKNGTQINGRPIAPHLRQRLETGYRLQFGSVETMVFYSAVMHDLLKEIARRESPTRS